jgi:hypothetical protein
MEYLGLVWVWKKVEGFALSEPTRLVLVVLGVAVVFVLVFNWLSKK